MQYQVFNIFTEFAKTPHQQESSFSFPKADLYTLMLLVSQPVSQYTSAKCCSATMYKLQATCKLHASNLQATNKLATN